MRNLINSSFNQINQILSTQNKPIDLDMKNNILDHKKNMLLIEKENDKDVRTNNTNFSQKIMNLK